MLATWPIRADPSHFTVGLAAPAGGSGFVRESSLPFCMNLPRSGRFGDRYSVQTGTRLLDWVDHSRCRRAISRNHAWSKPVSCRTTASRTSFGSTAAVSFRKWSPSQPTRRLAIRVDSVADFLAAHGMNNDVKDRRRAARAVAQGPRQRPIRLRILGGRASRIPRLGDGGTRRRAESRRCWNTQEAFRRRRRRFAEAEDGFAEASGWIRAAVGQFGGRPGRGSVFRGRTPILDQPQPRRTIPKSPAGRPGPGLGQPRPPHLSLQPRALCPADRPVRGHWASYAANGSTPAGKRAGGPRCWSRRKARWSYSPTSTCRRRRYRDDFAHAPLPPAGAFRHGRIVVPPARRGAARTRHCTIWNADSISTRPGHSSNRRASA